MGPPRRDPHQYANAYCEKHHQHSDRDEGNAEGFSHDGGARAIRLAPVWAVDQDFRVRSFRRDVAAKVADTGFVDTAGASELLRYILQEFRTTEFGFPTPRGSAISKDVGGNDAQFGQTRQPGARDVVCAHECNL